MPFSVQNDHSQLPVTPTEWRVAGRKAPATAQRSGAAATAASVPGQVGGTAAHGAPSLRGRAAPTTPARPRDPVGNAVFQNTHELNSVLAAIGKLPQGPNGELHPLARAMLKQLDRIGEACDLITGGPAVGESLVDQWHALADLAGRDTDAQGSLELGMEAIRDQGTSSTANLGKALGRIEAWTEQVKALAGDRLKYLSQSLSSSALNVSKNYETKANINGAAIAVLDEVIAAEQAKGNRAAVTVLQKGRDSFEARQARMKEVADERRGEIGRPQDFGGTKKFGALGKILHPFKASAERSAREKCVSQIVSGKGGADVEARGTNEMSVVEDALAQILKDAKVSGHNAKREVQEAFLEVLDANPAWQEPIKTEIHLPVVVPKPDTDSERTGALAVETRIAQSEIKPAPAARLPGYKGKGVNSHRSAEHLHSTNLAQTTLRDSAGHTLFSGVRHGVLSAYSITKDGLKSVPDHELERLMTDLLPEDQWTHDSNGQRDVAATLKKVRSEPALADAMRARANETRAKEVVAMTVAGDPELRAAAMKAVTDGSEPPTVNVLSLSLLTPDSFRKGVSSNESLMVTDQVNAWGAVSGLQTIQIPDDQGNPVYVRVNVQPVPMNYGVNQGAVKGVAGVHTDEVAGWHVSDTLNDEALHTLFGADLSNIANSRSGVLGERIGHLEERHQRDLDKARMALQRHNAATLRSSGANPEEANEKRLALEAELKRIENAPNDPGTPLGAVRELARQIGEIHREGAHRQSDGEAYKMPTRLAVLADLLGVKVAFNCKSGKDRTGELDAEIKHFKLQMAATGTVPDYRRERSPEEIRHFHEVVTNSGNFEMQQLNTGFTGYKLKGVDALYRQFGGDGHDELTASFHGLSEMTAS
ncbi:inositol phosphate phosphatase SopB [Peristeroidobacter soli]|uniref:inositol phosphate phosphatase SopB n=1 Tax=Peristeroidobacter soli TaxID=2497877 RepID=UPI00101BDB54|nr:inositol phosphate phosphatase SopB [Peristeroidobacter soli]